MFYGAEDAQTAVAEVLAHAAPEADTVTVATFTSQRSLCLLDLDDVPSAPSIFDDEARHRRAFFTFMSHFARDIARPADGTAGEYRPTQIVTEYVRYDVTDEWRDPVDGIVYHSSLPGGGRCVALFVDSSGCADVGTCDSARDWHDQGARKLAVKGAPNWQ